MKSLHAACPKSSKNPEDLHMTLIPIGPTTLDSMHTHEHECDSHPIIIIIISVICISPFKVPKATYCNRARTNVTTETTMHNKTTVPNNTHTSKQKGR